jgi:hypothetical protein
MGKAKVYCSVVPISDNPSPKKLMTQVEGFAALARLGPIIRLFGKTGRDIASKLDEMPEMLANAQRLTTLPDRFNAVFLERGWVSLEHLSVDVQEAAIDMAANGSLDAADAFLVDYWTPEVLTRHMRWLTQLKVGRPRRRLLELALEDHGAGRYHASVPVVLAQLDGLAADLGLARVFTGDAQKLVAYDSSSAHPEALPALIALLGRHQRRTEDTPLQLPERHAVLHGRNLAYDTKAISVKAWAALFAINDYASKAEAGQLEAPVPVTPPTVRDLLADWTETQRQKKLLAAWRPRVNVPLPTPKDPGDVSTPETAAAAWLNAWVRGDDDAMQSLVEVVGQLHDWMEDLADVPRPDSWEIRSVVDHAAAWSTIQVALVGNGKSHVGELEVQRRGWPGGSWLVARRSVRKIVLKRWIEKPDANTEADAT